MYLTGQGLNLKQAQMMRTLEGEAGLERQNKKHCKEFEAFTVAGMNFNFALISVSTTTRRTDVHAHN